MLGTKPHMGRLFLPEDGNRWISQTTVISYGIWKRLFGADPKVLGRRVYLDYDPFVIAGVLPPEFHHPGATLQSEPDFYITGSFRGGSFPLNPSHGDRMIPSAIGRLMPGVTLEQAQSKLEGFARQLSAQYPQDYPSAARWTPRITSLQASLAVGSRNILLVTMGAVMPGVTLEQAQSKLEGFARQLSAQYPQDYPSAARWTPRITSLQASLAVGSRN